MTQVISEWGGFLIDVTAEMNNTILTDTSLTFLFNAVYFVVLPYLQFLAYHTLLRCRRCWRKQMVFMVRLFALGMEWCV